MFDSKEMFTYTYLSNQTYKSILTYMFINKITALINKADPSLFMCG